MVAQERSSSVLRRGALFACGALSACVLLYCLYLARHVALIVALAGFWAYFLAWPAGQLRRWLPGPAAVRIVFYTSFLVIIGMLGPIGTVLYHQVDDLISLLPSMTSKLELALQKLNFEIIPGQSISVSESLNSGLEQLRQNAPSVLAHMFNASQTFVTGTVEILVALLLIPVISLYLLLDSERLRRAFVDVFPPRMRSDVDQVLGAVNRSLSSYIYSRVIMALFVGISLITVLMTLRVPFSLILGLLAFIAEFIPVIGAWIALVPACLIAVATNPTELTWLWVGLLFGLIQIIKDYVIAPRLMSETMDIHPLTVVLAMLIGGSIGGITGLVLAIPTAAALKVILNVFVFRRAEKGVHLPALDLIGPGSTVAPAEFNEAIPPPEPPDAPGGNATTLPAFSSGDDIG